MRKEYGPIWKIPGSYISFRDNKKDNITNGDMTLSLKNVQSIGSFRDPDSG